MKETRVQLVFAKHTLGSLSKEDQVQPQPPLGILTLASYIQAVQPCIQCEVIDGNLIPEANVVDLLDADIVGFSVWFSNYENSIKLAQEVRNRHPNTTIVMGGPFATWTAERILSNQQSVDYIIRGEGELPFMRILLGDTPASIPGVAYREDGNVKGVTSPLSALPVLPMSDLPAFDMTLLHPPYRCAAQRNAPGMSAFPLSGIRGCPRWKKRCEYCSIATSGYRSMPAEQYWNQVTLLHEKYGVEYFFETGDTCSLAFLQQLANVSEHPDVAFRIYSYPGFLSPSSLPILSDVGVRMVFLGIESILHWRNAYNRHFPEDYTLESLLDEINNYGSHGIEVWPAFLLGLPGEDDESLEQNISFIEKITAMDNVHEATLGMMVPLPGSAYFSMCLDNALLVEDYWKRTNTHLQTADLIDYDILCELFVEHYTKLSAPSLQNRLADLVQSLSVGLASWDSSTLLKK